MCRTGRGWSELIPSRLSFTGSATPPDDGRDLRVPTFSEKSWIFSRKFHDLESPGKISLKVICIFFSGSNGKQARKNRVSPSLCRILLTILKSLCLNSEQLTSTFLRHAEFPAVVYTLNILSNCCFYLYSNICVFFRTVPGKFFRGVHVMGKSSKSPDFLPVK